MWQKKLRILDLKQTRSCVFPGRGGPTGCPNAPQRGRGEKRRSFFVVESSSGLVALFLRQLIGNLYEAFTAILEKSAPDAAGSGPAGIWRAISKPAGGYWAQPAGFALILRPDFEASSGPRKRGWAAD